jgi:hypothetical protein
MVVAGPVGQSHNRFSFRTTAAGDRVKEAERSEPNAADAISVEEANNFIMIPKPCDAATLWQCSIFRSNVRVQIAPNPFGCHSATA